MTSLANTIRWTRRGNSEVRNKSTSLIQSPADSFKLPSLNALNKSIKYGDLTFATNRDMLKLRKEPEQVDNIQEVSAHHSLMVIRKKYDNMNKTRQVIQRQVDDLENKRQKFLSEKLRFEEEKEKGAVKVQELNHSLMDIKHSHEESEVEKKVMLSMVERLKHDKVVYDLRKYRLEKELTYIQRQQQIILKENAGKLQEEDKSRKIHQKLIEHLQSQQKERESHLKSMETMIAQKVSLNENQELRRFQMKEIAENALQDKDLKEKNWHKVYLCSRFVEKLLRDKMNREMIKFNTVETAFKNIKTSTGVSNTTELVKKFLNKETAYGELLGKIAENERTIAELKGESEDLAKERRKLEAEQDLLSSNKSEFKDLDKEEKQLHQMSEKSQHCQMLMEKLRNWGAKSIKKYNSIANLKEQVEIKSNPKDIIEQLKLYLKKISQSIDQSLQLDTKQSNSNVNVGGNNLRIALNPHQQPQNKHNERKTQTSIDDEQDFINIQRSEIIKNNDKFMKEVRKKHEDIKKAKFESEPKKKEVPAEKPKPQPIQS